MATEVELDVEALTDELKQLARRGLPRAFERLDSGGGPLVLLQLQAIAKRDVQAQWQEDRPTALETLLRQGIERLDGMFGNTDLSRRRAAYILFNLSSPGIKPLDLDAGSGKWSSQILQRLKKESHLASSTVRTNAHELRRDLAKILINPRTPSLDDPGSHQDIKAPQDVVHKAFMLKKKKWARKLLAISAAYARDIRVDADLHVVRTIEPDLLESLRNTSRPWPRAVVGEAGSGKSTLLWSLHQSLAAQPDMQPVLLSATWLLQGQGSELAEKIGELFQEFARVGSTPVLLLDTADLMLHDEEARQVLLRLLDAVHVAGFAGLYSTRPQEAPLLSHDELRRHDLQPYDDAELDHAVAALVARYCPDAPCSEVTGRVRQATARGLPVTEVCRSPLLLRLLFDLSAPADPELGDVDVTRLFDAYWRRRVIRDARTDTAIGLRARATENLSALAGHAGIGLLAAGLPELPAATLRDTTAVVAGSASDLASVQEGLAILTERGVLVPSREHLGFFHQTMFEFAAAKGLLARSDPATIGTLATRAISHGGDLFVGAVLEQVLILAGAHPLLHDAVQDAVRTLVTSDSEAVQAIGLVAWTHYPVLLDDATNTLRTAGASALERATRILPTIAVKPTGQTISQLMLIWQSTSEPHVRAVVLDAFARIALRAPRDVADALNYLEPLQAFTGTAVTPAMRRSLLRVLHAISSEARLLVRSTLVAMLMSTDDRASIELDYLADQWLDIGDDHLLSEVIRTLDDDGPPDHAVAAGLGKIIAAEWHRTGTWDDASAWADFLADAIDPGPATVTLQDEATLRAIGAFIVTLNDDSHIRLAIEALLDASDPQVRDLACQSVLRDILSSGSDAAAILDGIAKTSLATIGYAAQQGVIDDRQQLLLDLLAQAQLPEGLLARLLPAHLEAQDWTADHRLLKLAPAAADHGHPSAQRLLERVSRNPKTLSSAQLDAFFSTKAMYMPKTDEIFDAVISIATQTERTADLKKIIASTEKHGRHIDKHSSALLTHARRLLAGPHESKHQGSQFFAELMAKIDTGMAWPELRAVLDDVDDPQILVQLIQKLWHQTPTGDVSAQLDYLGQFITVQPSAERPVTRPPGRPVEISVAVASAWAMLYILGSRTKATTDRWPEVRTLGLYEVEGKEIFVEGRKFLIVCDYLTRLGSTNPRHAAERLIDYLTALATGEFHGNDPVWWRRELRNAVQNASAHGDQRVIESLVATCGSIDDSVAEVITTAIAERHYGDAREHLQTLSRADITATLRSFLLELIRNHDRSFGTRTFPEVLTAATR